MWHLSIGVQFPLSGSGRRRFATTRWSLVLAAGGDRSEQADRALAELCADYWYPLYAYVRRRGYEAEDAKDLTQAFFAKLLEKHDLTAVDPARGRFRSFLLTSLKNFLASEWRRQATLKRGGDVELVSIDYEDAENRYRLEPAHALTPNTKSANIWLKLTGMTVFPVTLRLTKPMLVADKRERQQVDLTQRPQTSL